MEREVFVCVLGSGLFALVTWGAAVLLASRFASRSDVPDFSEARCWRRLTLPVSLGAASGAFLIGWALQEPDPANERLAFSVWWLAAMMVLVGVRAGLRGYLSWRAERLSRPVAATLGFFRPHVVLSQAFASAARPTVLEAAEAHERAHARGYDPLRIWFAQRLADLQWPFVGSRARFEAWLLALEARRDDEAVASGAEPIALAEAILLAARLSTRDRARASLGAAAQIAGSGAEQLARRVRRLLDRSAAHDRPTQRERSGFAAPSMVALLAVFVSAGFLYGETVVAWLPGVIR